MARRITIALSLLVAAFLAGCANAAMGAGQQAGAEQQAETGQQAGAEQRTEAEQQTETRQQARAEQQAETRQQARAERQTETAMQNVAEQAEGLEYPGAEDSAGLSGDEGLSEEAGLSENASLCQRRRSPCVQWDARTFGDAHLYQGDQKSCIIQEDERFLYVCGIYRIDRIDKETKESEILWGNETLADSQAISLYAKGSSLLIGNRLYFIEAWAEEYGAREEYGLSVIFTDGTGYKRIAQVTNFYDANYAMLLQDGILYVAYSDLYYNVYKDGALSAPRPVEELKNEEILKDEEVLKNKEILTEVDYGRQDITYYDNGRRVLFTPELLKHFGFYIIRDDGSYCKEIPPHWRKVVLETGENTPLTQDYRAPIAYNSRYFLISDYEADSEQLYLLDAESLEKKLLAKYQGSVQIITMDEDYLYIVDESCMQDWHYSYERISLETGERSVVFTQDKIKVGNYNPAFFMDAVLKNGYLYYVGARDYQFYLMRRSLAEPSEEEILGEAFYDSGIGQVGTVESHYERIYSEAYQDRLMVEVEMEWLQVDERFPGAAEINSYLTKYHERRMEMKKGDMGEMEKLLEDSGLSYSEFSYSELSYSVYYAYYSYLPRITYFDGSYLSYFQLEEDKSGYGYVFSRVGYTFDLQTGRRLALADIISDSEEGFKDIMAEYFGELLGSSPYVHAPNPDPEEKAEVISRVRDYADMDISFRLTEEGIEFFFDEDVRIWYYTVGGVQSVTVPYGRFALKVPVLSLAE